MKPKYWYIVWRHNFQTGRYIIARGRMSQLAAKRLTKPSYGTHVVYQFDSEDAYNKALETNSMDAGVML